MSCSVPPPVHTHAHAQATHFMIAQPAQPCPLKVWGHRPGADKAPQGGRPPWAASGSETAHSCPRDENGKGGHLARPVSCGVSPAQSPGPGPRPLPIPAGAKGLGLKWRGHGYAGAQERGPPLASVCGMPLRLRGDGVQGEPSSRQLEAWGGRAGPWAKGSQRDSGHTDGCTDRWMCVCLSMFCRQGVDS